MDLQDPCASAENIQMTKSSVQRLLLETLAFKKASLELESYLQAAMHTQHEIVKVNPLCSPASWPNPV